MINKKIKIRFTDSFTAAEQTLRILKEEFYEVEMSDDPDFVFCSEDHNADFLNYNCARIFVTGEYIVPDFNCVDYAAGFDFIDFEDRYLRLPLYCLYGEDYELALDKHVDYKGFANKKFCNFIYSNGYNAMKERDDFYNLLSEYKRVDSGGRHLNNIGGPVKDKRAFQSNYKFSIAFENASAKGYTTEKILQAFSAGTIPIYYGNPRVSEDFNTKAFINCHDYNSFEEVVERVKEVDNSPELYEAMMREPVFTDMENRRDSLKEYREFLIKICSQDPEKAIRRCNDGWGGKLQAEKKRCYAYLRREEKSTVKKKVKEIGYRILPQSLWNRLKKKLG